MMVALSSRLERLNGWQRVWVVFAVLLALVIAGVTAAGWPIEPETGRLENPYDQFDPDAYLAKTAPAPASGRPRTLESIRLDPDYVNANDATKRAIFERWAPMDPSYSAADEPTRLAIRQRFGVAGTASSDSPTAANPFAKFVQEPDRNPEQKEVLEFRERLAQERREAADRQREELKDRHLAVSAAKMKLVGLAVTTWLGIVLGVYGLGWSFAWVRRGFRRGV